MELATGIGPVTCRLQDGFPVFSTLFYGNYKPFEQPGK
jgi:hypothetical protein